MWSFVLETCDNQTSVGNPMILSKLNAYESFGGWYGSLWAIFQPAAHCSFSYSASACFRMGMSGAASFQRVRTCYPSTSSSGW